MGKKTQCQSCGARWACRRWMQRPDHKYEETIYICKVCNDRWIARYGKYGAWAAMVPLDKDGKITEEVRANAKREENPGDAAAEQDAVPAPGRMPRRRPAIAQAADRLLAMRRRGRPAFAREILPGDG